jgi:hypothetical protein
MIHFSEPIKLNLMLHYKVIRKDKGNKNLNSIAELAQRPLNYMRKI